MLLYAASLLFYQDYLPISCSIVGLIDPNRNRDRYRNRIVFAHDIGIKHTV